MDLGGVDVWGQIALETSQMYVEEGGVIKSRFASTVSLSCSLTNSTSNFNVYTYPKFYFRVASLRRAFVNKMTNKYGKSEFLELHTISKFSTLLTFIKNTPRLTKNHERNMETD